jgi:hypothetical protein
VIADEWTGSVYGIDSPLTSAFRALFGFPRRSLPKSFGPTLQAIRPGNSVHYPRRITQTSLFSVITFESLPGKPILSGIASDARP